MRVRGFHFDFALTAPAELHRIAWLAGLGEKNALGFGALRQVPLGYQEMRQALQNMRQDAPMTHTTNKDFTLTPELAMAA
jgi:hypothetical protein